MTAESICFQLLAKSLTEIIWDEELQSDSLVVQRKTAGDDQPERPDEKGIPALTETPLQENGSHRQPLQPLKNDFVVHDFVKLLRVGINNAQVFSKFGFLFHDLRVNRPGFSTCDFFSPTPIFPRSLGP